MSRQRSPYHRHRFPSEIISHAVWLYYRFGISLRDVEDLLAKRGVVVSNETIRRWCMKFGPEYARKLKQKHGRLGDPVTIKGLAGRHTGWLSSCVLVVAALLASGRAAEAQSPFDQGRPALVGVELLGRAGLYSVNYERLLVDRAGLGAGVAYWGGSGGDRAVLVPLYASWSPVGRTHSLYLAGGATVVFSNVSLFGRSREYESGGIGHAAIGYQFRSRSGLVIRPTANYFFQNNSGVWWPGITIGASF